MGRTAEAEWIASEDGVIARSDKDPRWIPKQHKLRSAEVDWTREGQVIVYEGKALWPGTQSGPPEPLGSHG